MIGSISVLNNMNQAHVDIIHKLYPAMKISSTFFIYVVLKLVSSSILDQVPDTENRARLFRVNSLEGNTSDENSGSDVEVLPAKRSNKGLVIEIPSDSEVEEPENESDDEWLKEFKKIFESDSESEVAKREARILRANQPDSDDDSDYESSGSDFDISTSPTRILKAHLADSDDDSDYNSSDSEYDIASSPTRLSSKSGPDSDVDME